MKKVLPLLILFLVVGFGCKKRQTLPPPPASSQAPAAPPVVLPGPSAIETADSLFEAGDLEAAAAAYEALIEQQPVGLDTDRVLFRLGLIYATPSAPVYKPEKAHLNLSGLLEKTDGEFFSLASLLDSLVLQLSALEADLERTQEELDRVTRELETIKAIDRRSRTHIP